MPFVVAARRLALGCVAALLAATPSLAQSHDGDWAGVLKIPDGRELRLVLHVTTGKDGTTAVLDSLDQDASIPASAYKADGDKASILFLAIGGELEGAFAADGKAFAGTWTQGTKMPLTLTKTAPAAKP